MNAVFETELMSIQGVEQPKSVSSTSESTSSVTSSVASEATEGIKENIMNKAGDAAEAADGDGEEHNEL